MDILNKKHDRTTPADIYVGRPSAWGNPFAIGTHGTREEVIARYASWIMTQRELLNSAADLYGHNLVCHCTPEPCHAEILRCIAHWSYLQRLTQQARSGHYEGEIEDLRATYRKVNRALQADPWWPKLRNQLLTIPKAATVRP